MESPSSLSSKKKPRSTFRQRMIISVFSMGLLSVFGFGMSLYRISEVNQLLENINHISVPMGILFTQIRSDAEIFQREVERNLGDSHWKDPHWKPKMAPRWIQDLLHNEINKMSDLIKNEPEWGSLAMRLKWQEWAHQLGEDLKNLSSEAKRLHESLAIESLTRDDQIAAQVYLEWLSKMSLWRKQLERGATQFEQSLRRDFNATGNRVIDLRNHLEMVCVLIVLMSLLMIWLSERALRPLDELTNLAREITRRGLRKEDKALFPEISLGRLDEVSQLSREFHRMATALLEREKMVENQKHRLLDQNTLLREMGELNENILNSIESVLIVSDLNGIITQLNPEALRWLGGENKKEVEGTELKAWAKLKLLVNFEQIGTSSETQKLGPRTIEGRTFGGYLMPLKQQENDRFHGSMIVLHDLTDERDLQRRLRQAENLAAVGRMSAQVAHEVRNPLHSIGLEAELALDQAAGIPQLKQNIQSILSSVDRLESITENYLKLSRLSAGEKRKVDLGEILHSVLAMYTPICEAQNVKVDWERSPQALLNIHADSGLLEQVIGNLFKNSLQAVEGVTDPCINWFLGNTETNKVFLKIEDNGPGISEEVRDRLFTPFVTTRAQGTGLGLSFIKKVIEDHGGSIWNIDKPGKGACFEITLPLAVEENRYAENTLSR